MVDVTCMRADGLKEQDINPQDGLSCSPVVPDFIQKAFQDEKFLAKCLEKFDLRDRDRNCGVLLPSEVFPIIRELSKEQPVTITGEDCARLVEMFGQDQHGMVSKGEFCNFVKFVWFMKWLESQEEQTLAPKQNVESSMATNLLKHLDVIQHQGQEPKGQIGALSSNPVIPDFIQETFNKEAFIALCHEKFTSRDYHRNCGVLLPGEVFPIVHELSLLEGVSVTYEDCARLIEMFDQDKRGALSEGEFIDFLKFVWFMKWLEAQKVEPVAAPKQDEETPSNSKEVESVVAPKQDEEIPSSKEVESVAAPKQDEETASTQADQLLSMIPNDCLGSQEQVGNLCCSPVISDFIRKTFQDEVFTAICHEKFDSLDVDCNRVLSPSEVFTVILELSMEGAASVTYDHCARFVDMFDQDGKGALAKCEFCDFVQFVWFMRWLKSLEDQATGPPEQDEGFTRIDQMLEMMHKDRAELTKQVGWLSCGPVVPDVIRIAFQNEAFNTMCLEKFDSVDVDRNGVLSPSDLFPVSVTYDHCSYFIEVFDQDKKGLLSKSEFCDFVKFVWVKRWLESQKQQTAGTVASETVPTDNGIARIDQLLDVMYNDYQELMKKQIGRLSSDAVEPEFIRKAFQDESFIAFCLAKFDLLDVDGKGVLAPSDVFPIIVELSSEQPVSITSDHCGNFLEMFNPDKTDSLSKSEFCDFVKFVWFMRWLEAEDQPGAAQGQLTPVDSLKVLRLVRSRSNSVSGVSCSPAVPDFIRKPFEDEAFTAICHEKFDSLDVDRQGVLSSSEVFPVVIELSLEQSLPVTLDDCRRYVEIFDQDHEKLRILRPNRETKMFEQDVVLSKCEFCDFLLFVWFMRWLESHDRPGGDESLNPSTS